MLGFFVSGSSIDDMNGVYGPKMADLTELPAEIAKDVSIGAYCADGGFCFDGTIELTCEQGGACIPDFALNAEKINPVDNGCVCSSERKTSPLPIVLLMLLFLLSFRRSTRSQTLR